MEFPQMKPFNFGASIKDADIIRGRCRVGIDADHPNFIMKNKNLSFETRE
jgi:hypothetical protein